MRDTPARGQLLEAGWALLTENHGNIEGVKLKGLVERAGVTNGAFYHLWPAGIAEFQEDLLAYALDLERTGYLTELSASVRAAVVDPPVPTMPLAELIRVFGAQDAETIDNDRAYRVQVALWARHFDDPSLREKLQAMYRGASAQYAPMYRDVVNAFGLEFREPFDEELLAVALTALAEGLCLRRTVDPDATTVQGMGAEWDLFGLIVMLLVAMVTRPRDESDMRGLPELLQDMMGMSVVPAPA